MKAFEASRGVGACAGERLATRRPPARRMSVLAASLSVLVLFTSAQAALAKTPTGPTRPTGGTGPIGVTGATAATRTVCPGGPPTCEYKTIQPAINAANTGDTITIAAGTYAGPLQINTNLTLQGAAVGPGETVISGGDPVVLVASGQVTINDVRITGGSDTGSGGGGIHNDGTLTLNSSTVSGNTSASLGGGILNLGTLTLNSSTVSENKAPDGGGIAGSATLNDSVVIFNSATFGGGIYDGAATTLKGETAVGYNKATDGGGVFVPPGSTLTLTRAFLSVNIATEKGGGIYNRGLVTGSHSFVWVNSAKEGANIFNEGGTETLTESYVEKP
jgi:hypothetical protein